jgi:hypothetical protein
MNVLESAIAWFWEDASLVTFLEIVTNVQEASSLESGTELTSLCIARNQTRKPVICDHCAWNKLSFTAVLQTSFREY